jgi:Protein of unknown function (DUF3306)
VSESDSNFFSRWSRRKAEVREATAPATPAAPAPVLAEQPPGPATPQSPPASPPRSPAAPPAPTLADVDALTTQSDYTRFMSRDVAPDVKQAALKKLFTDPHFNVMDGLDVYIDDYGKPDPLPPGMLRQMMQSQLLGLFDHEKKDDVAGDALATADVPTSAAGMAPPPHDEEPADVPDLPGKVATSPAAPTTPIADP